MLVGRPHCILGGTNLTLEGAVYCTKFFIVCFCFKNYNAKLLNVLSRLQF